MKRYSELSKSEKQQLDDESFTKSVKLEAIERGHAVPIDLDNLLKQQQFVGYTIPGDAVFFYEIVIPGSYNSTSRTGLAFKTLEEARAAINGAIALTEEGYGVEARSKIIYGEITAREVAISMTKPKHFSLSVEEARQDTTEYDKLVKEFCADLQKIRQEDYEIDVNKRKREEYISLANGDIEIAKRFWRKTERGDFPNEDGTFPEVIF